MEQVILVDEANNPIGTAEKLEAHLTGRLHRALSVFIYNGKGELLLQRRAAGKYHSAGLWSNACCTHPRPGEDSLVAARRRLGEEMGLKCELRAWFQLVYRAELDKGLTEYEYDEVFFGVCNQLPRPDPVEVAEYRYISPQKLLAEITEHPANFTAWLPLCLEQINSL